MEKKGSKEKSCCTLGFVTFGADSESFNSSFEVMIR
jgi:hypothetical protein